MPTSLKVSWRIPVGQYETDAAFAALLATIRDNPKRVPIVEIMLMTPTIKKLILVPAVITLAG